MSTPLYRVVLSFDRTQNVFTARAPELHHSVGEGATRAEAIARLEEEMVAQVENMRAHGTIPPDPIDEIEPSGEIQLKLSRRLHRQLLWQAQQEGVDAGQLAAEMLAACVTAAGGGGAPTGGGYGGGANRGDGDGEPNGNRHPASRRGRGRHENIELIDDRASFIEYVRTVELGQQGAAAGNARRRRRRAGAAAPAAPAGNTRRRGDET